MASTSATSKVTLKLLVDKKNDVVLFAEAGKDFVDFLFHILALPVGTVIRLLTKANMVGSLGNLYDSIETLNGDYMKTADKDGLLKPGAPSYDRSSDALLLLPPEYTNPSARDAMKTYYRCLKLESPNCYLYVSFSSSSTCPACKRRMTQRMTLVEVPVAASEGEAMLSSAGGEGGYVEGVVTYMVMDNLVVKPMSTISSITLLNQFNVKDLSALEEKIVGFSFDEGVKLLKASLQSTTALTDVFLGRKKRAVETGA